jgi:tRNA A37 threonylcarbamoyladenosine dehydratase
LKSIVSFPAEEKKLVTRYTTYLDPTLLEIAEVLGTQPDTVLQWLIEGRLVVTQQDSQTVMMVDSHQPLKNQRASNRLVLTKKSANQGKQASSC